MYQLSDRSCDKLIGVHTDLVKIVYRAIQTTEIDFGVSEGLRSLETQKEYLAKGVTTTLNSRHLSGHAVDVFAYVGGIARWEMPLYEKIHDAFKSASEELGIPVEWGGGWKSFPDGPHFQLPWNEYPKVAFDSKS
jgi:peptidoglycan L-alanyl-D-glutamate endopeptidase CwlK